MKESTIKEAFLEYVYETFDINAIPLADCEKAYIDYYDEYSLSKCIMFQEDYHDDIIDGHIKNDDEIYNERVYATPIWKLYEYLKNNYIHNEWQFKVRDCSSVDGLLESIRYEQEMFIVIIPDIHSNIEIIKRESLDYGYYLFKSKTIVDDREMKWVLMLMNPLKQLKFNNFIRDNYSVIWYCSPVVLDEDIRKNGLSVSTNIRYISNEPSRLSFKIEVLERSNYKALMRDVADKIIDINPTREFYAYPIFFEDICDKYEFYKDPNAVESCMCFEDIPFEYVDTKRIKKVKF